MADLRILLVTPDFPPTVGGIQRLLVRVCEHLSAATVKVVTPAHPGAEAADRELPFEVVRAGAAGIRRVTLAAVNAAATREARSYRPDVVLVGHIVCSPGAMLAGRLLGVPVVQWFHADEIGTRPSLAAFAYRSAAASIAVSAHTKALIAEVAGDARKAHVINNGVDLPESSGNGARPGPPTVLTVARITERYKGHDVLARALPLVRARVPDVRWVVVGDGELRPSIESLVSANGVDDAVVFTGSVADEERDSWLRRSHVFAMPSRLPASRPGGEGFGIAYLEAGAHALPVVAGRVAGALDAVRDGETGLLVDPADHLAVAEAVADLLMDAGKAARMGRAGRAFAENHAWPLVAARVEDLLRSVAEHRQPTRGVRIL